MNMDIAVWVIAALIAIALLGAGITSLIRALLDNERRLTILEAKEQERRRELDNFHTDSRGRARKGPSVDQKESIEMISANIALSMLALQHTIKEIEGRLSTAHADLHELRNGRSK
jgi:hypothetical protein